MNKIGKLIMIIFGVLFFILFGESVSIANDNTDTIIAVVDGISIAYKDVQIHEDTIKFDSVLSQLQADDLQEELLKREQQRLLFQIEEIIINKAINKFNITVSEEEVDKEYDSLLKSLNIAEGNIQSVKNKMIGIVEALELYQKNPEQEKEIYQDRLSSLISSEEWEGYVTFYNTPAKIAEIKKHIPTFSEDIEKYTKQGIIEQLKLKKLKDVVSRDVKVTDEEIKDYYKQYYPIVTSWTVYHFYYLDERVLREVKQNLENNDDVEKIIQQYDLPNSHNGGWNKEVCYPGVLPFYAGEIYELSKGDVSNIVEGPLYLGWPGAQLPARFDKNEDDTFYHFIYLINIDREADLPKFEDVREKIKNELLNIKKETAWNFWIRNQIKNSNIEIFDDKFKNVLKKLTN
jgi:hypothetical protein